MAVLNATQLTALRQAVAAQGVNVTYDKATLNAAAQAVEDTFENSVRAQLSTAINAATSPVTLTAAQKTALVRFWLQSKFGRGG